MKSTRSGERFSENSPQKAEPSGGSHSANAPAPLDLSANVRGIFRVFLYPDHCEEELSVANLIEERTSHSIIQI